MAEVPKPSNDFLTMKKGGLPIWGWGAIGLVAAYLYSKWRAGHAATQAANTIAGSTGTSANEESGVPDFISETNITNNIPSTAIPPTVVVPPPVANPPSKTPGGGTKPPVVPPRRPPVKPKGPKIVEYRVKKGDTLTSIAKKFHTTWQDIYKFNTTAGNRPANTIKILKERGPNKLFSNEQIDIAIPQT